LRVLKGGIVGERGGIVGEKGGIVGERGGIVGEKGELQKLLFNKKKECYKLFLYIKGGIVG
jgi:hypothetical protein